MLLLGGEGGVVGGLAGETVVEVVNVVDRSGVVHEGSFFEANPIRLAWLEINEFGLAWEKVRGLSHREGGKRDDMKRSGEPFLMVVSGVCRSR